MSLISLVTSDFNSINHSFLSCFIKKMLMIILLILVWFQTKKSQRKKNKEMIPIAVFNGKPPTLITKQESLKSKSTLKMHCTFPPVTLKINSTSKFLTCPFSNHKVKDELSKNKNKLQSNQCLN